MKALIVNADGFGFTFGNNRAILEVLEAGFVRSVSVNTTWPAVREVGEISRSFPHVSIGIHLNLSVGPPILPPTEIPSLVSPNGEFLGKRFVRSAVLGSLDGGEMRCELRAQIDVLRELDVRITHWDSHQGRHNYPGFFEAATDVARECGIRGARSHAYYPVSAGRAALLRLGSYYGRRPGQIPTHLFKRWQTRRARRAGFLLPDRRLVLSGLGKEASSDAAAWRTALRQLPSGLSFIECHPGYPDDVLRRYSRLVESRRRELEMLLGEPWTETAMSFGVQPCSYFDLLSPEASTASWSGGS